MLVSHRKKFIFIKTSKTAGTSVEAFFEKHCFPKGEWQLSHSRDQYIGETGLVGGREKGKHDILHSHMPAKGIKELVSDEQWASYFKFSIVRNPFDRLVSRFFFNMKNQGVYVSQLTLPELKKAFDALVRKQHYPILGALSLNNEIVTDFTIRYENLHDDLKLVCEKLGVTYSETELPSFKSGIRDNRVTLQDLYTTELIAYVEAQYKTEIKTFGYQFPTD